jgi:membrane-bound lytic murein transglycosylase D
LKSRLLAMNAKSPFRIEYNQSLENVIKSFLKNRKRSFERLMAISEYYFPMFEEAFAKQNVPLEIKYLAVVESALNPKAVSKMGATGLWQFMYQTGKQYNLKIDSYVDERSDPLKATAAAAQYMTNMHSIFGDWELVLASYNSGPGNVSKAIRRSGGQQNYWNIRKNLPKETQGYVPAFLATMYIYEYHKEHGIKPDKAVLPHFATDTVMVKRQMSFKQISDLLDVPMAQLQLLNPSYKLNVIPFYEDRSHFLRLPKNKVAVFASNEDKIYSYVQHEMDLREKPVRYSKAIAIRETANSPIQDSIGTKTNFYKVKRGDNLGAIATKYNVDVSDLKKWNGLKSNAIVSGANLKIVGTESIATVKKEVVAEKLNTDSHRIVAAETKAHKEDKIKKMDSIASGNTKYYVVQKGDNLGNIAKKHNVTIADITNWNHISGNTINLGASLQVSAADVESKTEIASAPELKDIEYVVQKGDNLGNISKKFGTALADLREWNKLHDNNIAIGSTLIVARNEIAIKTSNAVASSYKKNELATAKKIKADYYVKKGDSLYSIAKKYPGVTISDLKKWNDIKPEGIKPGMKLKING